jgi:hypothetical protein
MHGDRGDEVVLGRHGGAQVKDADVRVGRHGRDDGRVGGRKGGAVDAVSDGERAEGVAADGGPNLDGPVPRARHKRVLGDGTPRHGVRLALVLVKAHDGERAADGDVKQLDGAVAARDDELVLVDLGPGHVVERVVCVKGGLGLDAALAEPQRVHAPVADDAKVCAGRDGEPRVDVGRELDGVGVVPARDKLEHRRGGHGKRS